MAAFRDTDKTIDTRIRGLIKEGVALKQRSLVVVIGDRGWEHVVTIHRIMTQAQGRKPSVLWCYEKDLGFATQRKKRMRVLKKVKTRGVEESRFDDVFGSFVTHTSIRWCYYKDSTALLGSTFGCVILQDFEALTANLLAQTVETAEGGGLVVLLVSSAASFKQIYSAPVPIDYAGHAANDITREGGSRFQKRLILSLSNCSRCLIIDRAFNIFPSSAKHLADFNEINRDTHSGEVAEEARQPESESGQMINSTAGRLVAKASTPDQANAVLTLIDALAEQCENVIAITAARGRGKSAAIGLSLAAAVATGMSSIFVTAPSAENVQVIFKFAVIGLKALDYVEHHDFELSCSDALIDEDSSGKRHLPVRIDILANRTGSGAFNAAVCRKQRSRHTIQYVTPETMNRHEVKSHAELIVVDEAAAVPLPYIRSLVGASLLVLASTIAGYEGTGRSLQLKLIDEIKQQLRSESEGRQLHRQLPTSNVRIPTAQLYEVTLLTPIRYAADDPVERWLHAVLCLGSPGRRAHALRTDPPSPSTCVLHHVNRNSLFSYHHTSERFLQRIMAIYSNAHYRNSPNDLQLMADSPAHRIFVLGREARYPRKSDVHSHASKEAQRNDATDENNFDFSDLTATLPDVLAVIQVVLEGALTAEDNKRTRGPGDLIPWTLAHHFCDPDLLKLTGVRVLRLATHPDLHSMGYGSYALSCLVSFFCGTTSVSRKLDLDSHRCVERQNRPESAGAVVTFTEVGGVMQRSVPLRASPPLLTAVSSLRPPLQLDWIGASFGATTRLQKFWARAHFQVVYVRQSVSQITGEHTTIVLRPLHNVFWLDPLVEGARRHFAVLLASPCFRHLDLGLALSILGADESTSRLNSAVKMSGRLGRGYGEEHSEVHVVKTSDNADAHPSEDNLRSSGHRFTRLACQECSVLFTHHDIRRLQVYSKNAYDHHLVADLASNVASLVFTRRLQVKLSWLQAAVLLGVALQRRDLKEIASELKVPRSQVHAFYNKALRKLFTEIIRLMAQASTGEA